MLDLKQYEELGKMIDRLAELTGWSRRVVLELPLDKVIAQALRESINKGVEGYEGEKEQGVSEEGE
jgi:hypothetical protein